MKPRDIIRRIGSETYYIIEQVVEDPRGNQVLVKEVESDSRWMFQARDCVVIGRSRLFE